MQPTELIDKYYTGHDKAKNILLAHSNLVAKLALRVTERVAQNQSVDKDFVAQAALLHDIGMLFTDSPELDCHGDRPYITHGIIGAEILHEEGLPRHALVCERHIGVGLSIQDIKDQSLPLPLRDMRPQTLEEKIVAYADLFYSKTKQGVRTAEMVRAALARHGTDKVSIFDEWHRHFDPQP
jgi:uncharacterized protein